LQAAWNAAQSGDTVRIMDGTYGSQALAAGTKTLTFVAAGPGRPKFGQLVSAAQNLTFKGIQLEDRNDLSNAPCSTAAYGVLVPCGQNQTFDNVIVDGLHTGSKHGIESPGDKFQFLNGEVRNIVNQKGFEGGADDMVIANTYFHDITVTVDTVHNECAYVDGGDRQVWRNNYFLHCPTMSLYFTNYNGGPAYRDVTVENNVFTHTLTAQQGFHPGCTVVFGLGYNQQNTYVNWTVRYNTFESCVAMSAQTSTTSDDHTSHYYGNLGSDGDCYPEWVYSYNVVANTCGGTHETQVPGAYNTQQNPNQAPFYTNAPAGDLHLKPGTTPINKADPNNYPPTDKDGTTRPQGTAPDAGAYEWH
jgi:hypothetical protein